MAERFAATNEEYHAMDGVSSSRLKEFDADPLKYYHQRIATDWPVDPPTAAMQFGTQVHLLIEHGMDWESMCVEIPDLDGSVHWSDWADASDCEWRDVLIEIPRAVLNSQGHKRGKPWTQWKKANCDLQHIHPDKPEDAVEAIVDLLGRIPIDRNHVNPFKAIVENINGHKAAAAYLNGDGEAEVNVSWLDSETGLRCRARLDRIPTEHDVIVDIKTTGCKSLRTFHNDIERRGYHQSLGFYQMGWEELTGTRLPCVLVAIENKPGFNVNVIEIADEWVERGRAEIRDIMLRYMECQAKGVWLPENHGTIIRLAEPHWAAYEDAYHLEV